MQLYEETIIVPYSVLTNLHQSGHEAVESIKQQAAIRFYKKGVLSLGKAAELSGMKRLEFIDFLRFNGEPVFEYSDEELIEIQNDSKMLDKLLSCV